MMVAHSVEVVQVVVGKDGLSGLVVFAGGLLPRLRPGSRVQILHALTPLHHMGGHVQSSQWEAHQCGQLVPPLANLFQQLTRTIKQTKTSLVSVERHNFHNESAGEVVCLRQKKTTTTSAGCSGLKSRIDPEQIRAQAEQMGTHFKCHCVSTSLGQSGCRETSMAAIEIQHTSVAPYLLI